eukprot:4073581-Prymnesium_polylepis.1
MANGSVSATSAPVVTVLGEFVLGDVAPATVAVEAGRGERMHFDDDHSGDDGDSDEDNASIIDARDEE